ncbi:uncharacterized protein LOC107364090 isoform X3 [Tetranychus urticae]|uniref:uncharacterized protein LOC107364090 isoform X3 n=1 Tax=Tetranychus urticae TaxID=32264 RepID=UPI00077C07AE|nr:uncharacterized protein LOC107364090 isoform X3 [Tetranychus urticae]
MNSMWNLCRMNCPALPYDNKLEAVNNRLNWTSQANGNIHEMYHANNKKDHLVIATQPKNYVISKAVAPSLQNQQSNLFNPITNLLTSDIRSTSPGSVVVAAANRFLKPINRSSDPFFGGFGCRKKQHPVYNRNKAEIGDVNGFGLRSKSEERQVDHNNNTIITANPLSNTTIQKITSIKSNQVNLDYRDNTESSKYHCLETNNNINRRSRSAEPNRLIKIDTTNNWKQMDVTEMPNAEPASNPNNCGKKVKNLVNNFTGSSEYRAAFNWPPGSQPLTTSIAPTNQLINANGTSTTSVSLMNGVKSQTIADFSEISANNQSLPQQIPVTSNQFTLAPGPAGLPSHCGMRNEPGEWVKDNPQILFSRATPSPQPDKPGKPITKTEYKKKFKPFSTYVYIPGSGWKKSKKVDSSNATGIAGSSSEGALEWYDEVVERAKKACEFRSRSQFGHPIVGVDHLESIYRKTSSNLWNQPKDRSIAALALATSHHLRVSTRPSKVSSRDSSRDSSKAGSDRITSNHLNASISPQKENSPTARKQFAPKSKSLADKKRSGGLNTPAGARPASVESEGGKIWLKPRKEDKSTTGSDKGDSEKKDSTIKPEDGGDSKRKASEGENGAPAGASSLGTSGSLTPLLSPREKEGRKDEDETASNNTKSPNTSDDQPRSPRPNSLVGSIGSITNGGIDLASPPALPDGPVKTTEIKSPEEVTGVKSPSPELWRVTVDTGTDINWTESKPANIVDNNNKVNSNNNGIGEKDASLESNNDKLEIQSNEKEFSSQKQSGDNPENVKSSETNEDLYGPLSL